jgi:hypothetical protein
MHQSTEQASSRRLTRLADEERAGAACRLESVSGMVRMMGGVSGTRLIRDTVDYRRMRGGAWPTILEGYASFS